MKLTRVLCSTAVAATLLWAHAANAERYQFILSGDYSAKWVLDTDKPDSASPGNGISYYDVAGTYPGSPFDIADIRFGNGSQGGGLFIVDSGTATPLLQSTGPQIYGGSEDNFVFAAGTYALSGFDVLTGAGSYSLNISVVPEPATYGMLLAGLGLVGVTLRRRQVK
ncbi:PEPxxWA-CTERM sorting domain-containing protein [Pseudoduganella umbonata]|uniref:PEP-CTERM sorting domain-containing protein n=1 Tax=Pseudoduganella umbonata TaxID=864828 RepID=A0A4P8HLC7_9BURK|nr:PEPxxWA-CTERM sorting domain-containing protein [Pseudoduganella umbonata]MBB3221671.1 hypothetical protein [Pseudoduganella umbonata]QCP09102.1 PEP-CTERM sorting domain-containing protein [Pseudoduganella umbonata]